MDAELHQSSPRAAPQADGAGGARRSKGAGPSQGGAAGVPEVVVGAGARQSSQRAAPQSGSAVGGRRSKGAVPSQRGAAGALVVGRLVAVPSLVVAVGAL